MKRAKKKTPLRGVQRGFVLQDKLSPELCQQFHDPCSRILVHASIAGAIIVDSVLSC